MEPIKVLIVDDTPENLVALEALLRRPGVVVLQARSGGEALEQLLVNEVSLAMLDVQMPEMDGFELAELMRGSARTTHVPIIFVTAGSRDPNRVFKGYESGAVDFLFKPIDPHILRSKVDVFVELARQRRELAHMLELNEMFLGVVGHDLRSPLGAIVAGCEVLRATHEGDARTNYVIDRMLGAGKRMTAMIEQLVDLTRVRLGGIGFTIDRQPIDMRELLQRTIDEMRAMNPDRAIVFDAVGDTATSGDPDRLLQLFSNLVGNAIAHGERGAEVAAHVAAGDREIVVEVRNKGTIAPDTIATMFQPFRGRRERSSHSTGLGLGLFISHEIAAAHGGSIQVESSEGGTVFAVHLPRTVAASSSTSRA